MPENIRQRIRDAHFQNESEVLARLIESVSLSGQDRLKIVDHASQLIESVRNSTAPGVMEAFLAEYGLSTDEGVALMCLAEALLRVPDDETIDELIRDKIAPHDWASHVGDSGSILINASTWALMLTGRVLDEDDPGVVGALQSLVRRVGEPVLRVAVKRAMQELGSQFVLGENIQQAIARGAEMEARGYTYSFDMLGEAARTHEDAARYYDAYVDAIKSLAEHAKTDDIRLNPGISVKLSALHPRYEQTQISTCLPALSHKLIQLCELAAACNVGLNIDAEEANRLELSLDIIESVLDAHVLGQWNGLGIVVQAYGRRASHVLDWLYAQAKTTDRKLMVRLVKGAYWDSEVKQSQTLGHPSFPVFTRKAATDVSYLACAEQLLGMNDRIYAQFATHNAHTVAAILHLAGKSPVDFEFQRLHGMGEAVHDLVLENQSTRCRIYAPVGAHQDLLAYLVRRLLENGANSSFVNQIVDHDVAVEEVAKDPFDALAAETHNVSSPLTEARDIYQPERSNSQGWDISHLSDIAWIDEQKRPFLAPFQWCFDETSKSPLHIHNPARPEEMVGSIDSLGTDAAQALISRALAAQPLWEQTSVTERSDLLNRIADTFESNAGEIFALLSREAGKTLADAIAELREAVDFLRYYAARANRVEKDSSARGVIVCISPWNFPLAIFSGQIAAALATGNAVVAKPAEQTPLIASRAIELMHEAGVPDDLLQRAVGDGETIGAALTSDPRIGGVCFTGSTEVARIIERQLAKTAPAQAMLIAETGGLNAMIVDSTALPEQAVRDILVGAFQSAGQRCSALRMLYLQEDRARVFLKMLKGAMDTLVVGDPSKIETDVGPVIDAEAKQSIDAYIESSQDAGRIEKTLQDANLDHSGNGHYVRPTLIRVDGIDALESEVFGPVLHYATFDANQIDDVVNTINDRGFGLTLGLHSRIDARVQDIIDDADVGNIYINRNQIGAIVGSQPFGGEGLSGTGPKAGGPNYLARFRKARATDETSEINQTRQPDVQAADVIDEATVNAAFNDIDGKAWERASNKIGILRSVLRGRASRAMGRAAALECGPIDLPGPTGESNRLSLYPLGRVVCLNNDPQILLAHAVQALRTGNSVVCVGPDCQSTLAPLAAPGIPIAIVEGTLDLQSLRSIDVQAVATTGSEQQVRALRLVLSERDGAIVRLISEDIAPTRFAVERAVCIDTTAAGGNAELLAASS